MTTGLDPAVLELTDIGIASSEDGYVVSFTAYVYAEREEEANDAEIQRRLERAVGGRSSCGRGWFRRTCARSLHGCRIAAAPADNSLKCGYPLVYATLPTTLSTSASRLADRTSAQTLSSSGR